MLGVSNRDLYDTIKEGIVRGPSIIFSHDHEKDETRIRGVVYGDDAKTCEKILGMDANALYLYCMSQPMPTGYP